MQQLPQRATASPKAAALVALLVLCTLLGLATTAHADASITTDFTDEGLTYNGFTYNLNGFSQSTAPVVVGQVLKPVIVGSGLTLSGYSAKPTSLRSRLVLRFIEPSISDSQLNFRGFMPPNSNLYVSGGTASMQSNKPVFDISGFVLEDNVTLVLTETAVTWSGSSGNAVVGLSSGSNIVSIGDASALFVLGITASRASSVLSAASFSSMRVYNNSVLAIDYSNCTDCLSSLVYITQPLTVTSNSLFRVTNCKSLGSTSSMITYATLAASSNSALLLENNAVSSGVFFSPAASSTPSVSITDSSIFTFSNLLAPSSGLSSSQLIPSSVDSSSSVFGQQCAFGGQSLTTSQQYKQNGLNVGTVLSDIGKNPSTRLCASSTCVPGNTVPASNTADEICTCVCEDGSNPPSCTGVVDPILDYNFRSCVDTRCVSCPNDVSTCTQCQSGYVPVSGQCVACSDSNCAECSNGPSTCTQCQSGYYLVNGKCSVCSVSNCAECSNSPSTCTQCQSGYVLVNGQCQSCSVGNCVRCVSGSTTKCAACASGYVPNKNGACVREGTCTDPDCGKCPSSDPDTCLVCNDGYIWNTGTQQCEEGSGCGVVNCAQCVTGSHSKCAVCKDGYGLNSDGTCTPCYVENCLTCAENLPNQCTTCKNGLPPDSTGRCKTSDACNVANCKTCFDNNAYLCKVCESGYYWLSPGSCASGPGCGVAYCAQCDSSDSTRCKVCESGYLLYNGTCSLCYAQNCLRCFDGHPTQCDKCASGYVLDSSTLQCKAACYADNCDKCAAGNPYYCASCTSPYVDQTGTGVCKPPCNIAHCDKCELSNPNRCSTCESGYKLCRPCGKDKCKKRSDDAGYSSSYGALATTLASVGLLLALNP